MIVSRCMTVCYGGRCVSRKLLIDMMLEGSYILMGGIRLHEKA